MQFAALFGGELRWGTAVSSSLLFGGGSGQSSSTAEVSGRWKLLCNPRIVRRGIGIKNSIKILFPTHDLPSVRIRILSLGIFCSFKEVTRLVHYLHLITYSLRPPECSLFVPETLVGWIVRVLVEPLVLLAVLARIILPLVRDCRLAVVTVARIATASSSIGLAAFAGLVGLLRFDG